MSTPGKTNKATSQLSKSRKDSKSYLERYKERTKNGLKSSTTTLHTKQQGSLSAASIYSQSENMNELSIIDADMQNIRIEEEIDEYQIMTNEYLQTERMWSKKINQTKNDINQLKQSIKGEQKVIKEMEKDITTRRTKFIQLEEKLQKSNEIFTALSLYNYDEVIENLQNELDQINEIGERSMQEARSECEQLQRQNTSIDNELLSLEEEINQFKSFKQEKYNLNLTELLEEQGNLALQVEEMEREIEDIVAYLKEREESRPMREQVHRRYLELYEKMLINQKLDKMTDLVSLKEVEIARMEDYGRRKVKYRQRRKEIQAIEYRIIQKKNTIGKLEEQIRDRSTKLLNLYQMEM